MENSKFLEIVKRNYKRRKFTRRVASEDELWGLNCSLFECKLLEKEAWSLMDVPEPRPADIRLLKSLVCLGDFIDSLFDDEAAIGENLEGIEGEISILEAVLKVRKESWELQENVLVPNSELVPNNTQAAQNSELVPNNTQAAQNSEQEQNSVHEFCNMQIAPEEGRGRVVQDLEVIPSNIQASRDSKLVPDSAQVPQNNKLEENSEHTSSEVQIACVDSVQIFNTDSIVPVSLRSKFVRAGNNGDAVKDVIQPDVTLGKLVSSWDRNGKLDSTQATHGKEVLALFEPKMRISLEEDSVQVSGSELDSMLAVRDNEVVPDEARFARNSKLKQNSKQTQDITKVVLQGEGGQVAPEVVAINAQATQENELVPDSAQALQASELKEGSKHVSNKVQNTCGEDNVQTIIYVGSVQVFLKGGTELGHCSRDKMEAVRTDLVSDKFPELWEDDAKLDKVQAMRERKKEGLLKLFELEGQQAFSTMKASSSTPDSSKQEVLQHGKLWDKLSCSWEDKAKVDSKQASTCDGHQQISSQGFELEVQQNSSSWTVSFAEMDSSEQESNVTRASHEIGGGECHDPRVRDPMTWARMRLFPQRLGPTSITPSGAAKDVQELNVTRMSHELGVRECHDPSVRDQAVQWGMRAEMKSCLQQNRSMLLKPSAAAEGVFQDLNVTRASHGMGVRECHDPRDRDQFIRGEPHVNKWLYHTSHPGMHYSHVIHPVSQFSLGHRHKTWARWHYGWKIPWSDHLDQQVVHEPCRTYILNKEEWNTRCYANYGYFGLKVEVACSLPYNQLVESNMVIYYIKEYNKGWWRTRQKEEMAKQRGSGAALLICTAMVGGVFHYGKEYCKHMEYGSMRWQGTLLASVGIKERKSLKID